MNTSSIIWDFSPDITPGDQENAKTCCKKIDQAAPSDANILGYLRRMEDGEFLFGILITSSQGSFGARELSPALSFALKKVVQQIEDQLEEWHMRRYE
ncbi:MAG: hypothetical protein AB7H97_03270 [Pseudobdellovibrionaceae bacterium]